MGDAGLQGDQAVTMGAPPEGVLLILAWDSRRSASLTIVAHHWNVTGNTREGASHSRANLCPSCPRSECAKWTTVRS